MKLRRSYHARRVLGINIIKTFIWFFNNVALIKHQVIKTRLTIKGI